MNAVGLHPFGSLLKKVIDNRGRTCPVGEKGIPLIATNCIVNSHLYPQYENVRYVSDEVYADWFRGHPEPGDMIFVLKGTPGRVALVPNPVDFCIAQDMVAIRADETKVYPKYLFAVLRSNAMQQEIEGLHVGSLIPHFKKGDFDDLRIPCVESELQKYIGDQYFDLSRKIDLLQRQNKTLEAIAEMLFRQWFVEERSDDWDEGKVEDLFVLQRGFDLPAQDRINGPYPIFTASGKSGGHTEYKVKGPGVTTGRSGLLGKVFLVLEDFWPLNTSLYVKEFKRGTPLFSYFFLKTLDLGAFNAGSAVPTLNRNHVHVETVLLPPAELIACFEAAALPLLQKVKQNESQIRSLEKTRDTLLPKLMSGEIRVAA